MNSFPLTSLLLVASSSCVVGGCGWVAGVDERESFPPDAAIDATMDEAGLDASGEAEGSTDSAPEAEAADAAWGTPESCNLLDDDFDGVVDNGFEWSLGPWQKIASLSGGELLKTARLSDGTTVVLLAEHSEPDLTRLSMVSILPDGTPSGGNPIEVTAARSIAGYGIARTLDDEVGVAFVENDEAACATACPLRLIRYRDGALVESTTISFTQTESGLVPVASLLDFTATSANYAFLYKDRDGRAWLNWKDQVFFTYGWKGLIDGIAPSAGSLGVGGAVAWQLGGISAGEQQSVMFGVVTPGGYQHILIGKQLFPAGGGAYVSARPGARSVAWIGSATYFGVTHHSVPDSAYPELFGFDRQGSAQESIGFASQGDFHSLVEFRGGLIASGLDGEEVRLARVDSLLHVVGERIVFSDAVEHALVSDGGDPLVVRISQDGSAAYVAKLGCM